MILFSRPEQIQGLLYKHTINIPRIFISVRIYEQIDTLGGFKLKRKTSFSFQKNLITSETNKLNLPSFSNPKQVNPPHLWWPGSTVAGRCRPEWQDCPPGAQSSVQYSTGTYRCRYNKELFKNAPPYMSIRLSLQGGLYMSASQTSKFVQYT